MKFRPAPDNVRWATVRDFPSYSVSDEGHVRRDAAARGARAGHLIRSAKSHYGYRVVLLRCNGVKRVVPVHRLVAEAFVGHIVAGTNVNHINGVKHDNRAENLEIVTPAQNSAHAAATGLSASGERHGMAKLTEKDVVAMRSARGSGEKLAALSARFGVSESAVSTICSGKAWACVPMLSH